MSHIRIEDLKALCKQALTQEGMSQENAQIVAETLAQTDALGTHSHGAKNLHGYILKARAGGVSLTAEPEVVMQSESCAVIDAKNTLGMIPSAKAVDIACQKAAKTGIAMTAVYHSCHFGAAGYYANLAAQKNMIGIAVSNVDANMNVPGARGRVMGNNPFAYAAPAKHTPSVFLDIALSNVASLKVVQAKKDGRSIPDTWIVDADGLPTTDPSIYPEHGAMQPMAAHKGYGLAVMVELLTGVLMGQATSMSGQIPSWCFKPAEPNNVCHSFIVIDPARFGNHQYAQDVEAMAQLLRGAELAKNASRIYTPGEIEWDRFTRTLTDGVELPEDVEQSLRALAADCGLTMPELF